LSDVVAESIDKQDALLWLGANKSILNRARISKGLLFDRRWNLRAESSSHGK
jgi:hypothetical protein